MPPRFHHPHHHHHHHGHRGPGLAGALVAGAVAGGVIAATRPPPPAHYVRGRRYKQVVIVHQPPQGMVLQPHETLLLISCPLGCGPNSKLEIEVEGRAYSITVPPGIQPGGPFYVRVPKPRPATTPVVAATPAPPPPAPVQGAAPPQQAVYQAQPYQPPPTPQPAPVPAAPATAVPPQASVVGTTQSSTFASGGGIGGGGCATQQPPEAAVVSVEPAAPAAATTTSTISAANPFGDEPEPASASSGWVVAPRKAEFDAVFTAAGPTAPAGSAKLVLSPAQVKDALLPLGLARDQLRLVWELSDIDKDGTLDADEFAVALYLVHSALDGVPVPPSLPANVVPPSKRNPF